MIHLPSLPIRTLRKALSSIAYDSGLINRYGPEESVLVNGCLQILQLKHGYGVLELRAVGDELETLSEEELNTLCIGEHGLISVGLLTARVLDDAADAMTAYVAHGS